MQLGSLGLFVITASLVCACAAPQQTARHAPSPPTPTEYKMITPDVTTYPPRTPERAVQPPDESEDVMASILAIPPGQ